MEWLRSFFPISSQSPQRAFNDEWVIVGDKTKTIDPELKKSLEAHFPKTAPQLFETCLARFKNMVLMYPASQDSFSCTVVVAIKNKAQETHTFALRLLQTDQIRETKLKDRYLRLRPDMRGAEWDRFYYDDRFTYAIGRERHTQQYQLLDRYQIIQAPYAGPEYELFATVMHYTEHLGFHRSPFLKKETQEALREALPLKEPELFAFCLANTLPELTLKRVLGAGKLSKVWLASYTDPAGEQKDLALRISRTESLPLPSEAHLPLFQISPKNWGSEFNAFLVDDPYMVDTHYAIVWSAREGRFLVLDKYAIQREKTKRSGDTYTLYATISPFLEGSQTLTDYAKTMDLSPALLRNLATQLLLALANLPRGINHRDLKPDNILVVTAGPVLKLLDFGFSSVDTEEAGDIRGTPLTLAPELLDPGEHNLHKADLFSLYATLHWMMYKTFPFQASNISKWRAKISDYVTKNESPAVLLKNFPFAFESEGEQNKFLRFMGHLGHPDPNERWTATKLLEEDCFLRAPEKPKPPPRLRAPRLPDYQPPHQNPSSPLNARLLFQITIIAGLLAIIYSTTRNILKRYINRTHKLPSYKTTKTSTS